MFDEMFLNGHEDIDLCYRYRQRGMSAVYVPQCTVTHHESVSEGRMERQSQNLTRTFKKWRPHLLQDDLHTAFPETERTLAERPRTFAINLKLPTEPTRPGGTSTSPKVWQNRFPGWDIAASSIT